MVLSGMIVIYGVHRESIGLVVATLVADVFVYLLFRIWSANAMPIHAHLLSCRDWYQLKQAVEGGRHLCDIVPYTYTDGIVFDCVHMLTFVYYL